jgi:hypothetical protein
MKARLWHFKKRHVHAHALILNASMWFSVSLTVSPEHQEKASLVPEPRTQTIKPRHCNYLISKQRTLIASFDDGFNAEALSL